MQLIKKITPKKLKELYWDKNLSSPKIAVIYNCDPKYIRSLFKKYGIKI